NAGGNVPVGWRFDAVNGGGSSWAGATPASGTLAAGQTTTFQVSPQVCPPPGTTSADHPALHPSLPLGRAQPDLQVTDTMSGPPPLADLVITGNQDAPLEGCGYFGSSYFPPSPYTVTLANDGNVPVGWQFQPSEFSGSTPWAIATAASGTLAPGAS